MSAVIGLEEQAPAAVTFRGERVTQKNIWGLVVVAVVVAAGALGLMLYERSQLQEARARVVAGELQPIAMLLKEHQTLLTELQAEPFTEKDSGILESYLAKIRRDGVPKHADMKQKLDALAENNTAIVTLIKVYAPHAKTLNFRTEADKFRNYASAWRDRWNSVMELFMAGGNYAAAGVPYPNGFQAAVEAEIQTQK
jgi:hypothetical protein